MLWQCSLSLSFFLENEVITHRCEEMEKYSFLRKILRHKWGIPSILNTSFVILTWWSLSCLSTVFCGFTQEPFWGLALSFAPNASRLLCFSLIFCSLFAIFPDYLVVHCFCCLQYFCIYNIERNCKLLSQPDNHTCHISNLSVHVKLNP